MIARFPIVIAILLFSAGAQAQNVNITKDRIQFPDGTLQSTAAVQSTSERTVNVKPVIGDLTASGQALLDAVADIASAADATGTFPYHIVLEPGGYDIGNANLDLPRYVNIRGAGPQVTRLRGNPTSGAVLETTGNSVITDLTIRHRGGSGTSGRAAIAAGADIRFENVLFQVLNAFDPGATIEALSTNGGTNPLTLIDCEVEVTASSSGSIITGIDIDAAPSGLRADGLLINIDPGATPDVSVGLWVIDSDDVDIANTTIRVTSASLGAAAIFGETASLIRGRNCVIEGTGGAFAIDGSTGGSATPIRMLASQIIGATQGDNLIFRNCVDGSFNAIP